MKGMTSEDNSSGGQNWTGPRMIAGEGILDRPNAHLKTIKTEGGTGETGRYKRIGRLDTGSP